MSAPEPEPEPAPEPAPGASPGTPVGRRLVLGLIGLGAVGVATGAGIQRWFDDNLGPIAAKDSTGLASLLPLGNFRLYTVTGEFPSVANAKYRLRVEGLIEAPTVLTLADLEAMPATDLTRDFQCVTGWRVADVEWRGVLLRDLLDLVGVSPTAKAVRFTSFDGEYTESLTLEQARRDDVLVAYRLQGAPIGADHGGPVRLYVAPMYGYKSCKWLDTIELTDRVMVGYWERRGYDPDAWVGRSNGRTDSAT
ncbi:MAG: molybdopterin-dependent oxidoreductase [Actinomycetes bacterium]